MGRGHKLSEETKRKIGLANSFSLKDNTPWNKGIMGIEYKKHFKNGFGGIFLPLEKHPMWKKGIYIKNPSTYKHNWYQKHRNKIKEKETYQKNKNNPIFVENRKKYKKQWCKNNPIKMKVEYYKRRKLLKDLCVVVVQRVYEDNIKKYGTLTCYLCEKPIKFGLDHLEHKTPLSRGGTNDYENLAVACRSCNCSKQDKTEKEYRNDVLKTLCKDGELKNV